MKGSFSEFLVLTHPLQKACTAPCGINANELKHSLRKQNLYVNIVKEGVFLHFICCRFEIILRLCKTFIYREIPIYLCLEAYSNVFIVIIDAVKRLLSSIFVSNFLLFESIGHNYPWRSI